MLKTIRRIIIINSIMVNSQNKSMIKHSSVFYLTLMILGLMSMTTGVQGI